MKKNSNKYNNDNSGFDVLVNDRKQKQNIYAKYSRTKKSFGGTKIPDQVIEQDNPDITMVFSANIINTLNNSSSNNNILPNNNDLINGHTTNNEILEGQFSLEDLGIIDKVSTNVVSIKKKTNRKLDLRGFEFADDPPKTPSFTDNYIPDQNPKSFCYKKQKKKRFFRKKNCLGY